VEHVEDGISKLTSLDFGEKENPNLIRVKKIVVERNIRDVKMFLLPRKPFYSFIWIHGYILFL
jgi:hypothetical protein